MKKTKIVCTIGPASESKEVLTKLVQNGMNVARLNMSHGKYDETLSKINTIREINDELGTHVALLLDTKGPEIRTHSFKDGKVELKKGNKVTIVANEIEGTAEKFSITYQDLVNDVNPDDHILVDDGQINLLVLETTDNEIICEILNDGVIKDRRGINVPDIKLSMDFISEKDKKDIEFACDNNLDFIAASFTRRAEDIEAIREILKAKGKENIRIIAKIENREGYANLDQILDASDGIMVARGDLGVEVFVEEVPMMQRDMIGKCLEKGKVSIVATQMLDSMQRNPRPTRAEANDVATAVLMGADAVMLSGETAAGEYPVAAVETMAKICIEAEQGLDYEDHLDEAILCSCPHDKTNAIAISVASSALSLDVRAIIAKTRSGYTARKISKFRPEAPVLALTTDAQVARSLAITWGVKPVVIPPIDSVEQLLSIVDGDVREMIAAERNDVVIVTAGIPFPEIQNTNFMKIHTFK